MLRVGIIGVGWAGQRHIQAIRELNRGMRVTCLVDNDADHLAAVATEMGMKQTFTAYADALADPNIDAVSICTPHALHCLMAVAAAEAGKHVLCEKPMAVNVNEATRMIEAAERNGVTMYVAENVAYNARVKFLRRVLSAGDDTVNIGEPTHVIVTRGFAAQAYGFPGRRAWLAEPKLGGSGAWLLQGIHTVAEVRAILVPTCGEVETVYAREHKARSFVRRDLEGTVSALLTFENGLNVSLLQTSETRLPSNLKAITVHGDRGSLRATLDSYEYFAADGASESAAAGYEPEALSTYAQEMEAFADAIASRGAGVTPARSERRSLAVVLAGYESIQSGRPVHLPSRFGDLYAS